MRLARNVVLATALAFSSAPALGSGIPVVDAAAIAKATQQFMQLKKQWETLKNQLEQQERQLKAMTGSAGYGSAFGNSARQYQENFPENWEEAYSSDDFWSMAESAIDNLDREIEGMDRHEAVEYTRRRVREKAAHDRAMMQQIYNNQLAEMQEIEQLTNEIDHARTQKEIQDLQARIQTAQGAIQAEQMRLTKMVALQESQRRMYEDQRQEAFKRMMIGDPDESYSPKITTDW